MAATRGGRPVSAPVSRHAFVPDGAPAHAWRMSVPPTDACAFSLAGDGPYPLYVPRGASAPQPDRPRRLRRPPPGPWTSPPADACAVGAAGDVLGLAGDAGGHRPTSAWEGRSRRCVDSHGGGDAPTSPRAHRLPPLGRSPGARPAAAGPRVRATHGGPGRRAREQGPRTPGVGPGGKGGSGRSSPEPGGGRGRTGRPGRALGRRGGRRGRGRGGRRRSRGPRGTSTARESQPRVGSEPAQGVTPVTDSGAARPFELGRL